MSRKKKKPFDPANRRTPQHYEEKYQARVESEKKRLAKQREALGR